MCWSERIHAAAACAVLTLIGGTAAAQPAPGQGQSRPWVLGVGTQLDEADSHSVLASLNWAVADETWLTFGAGSVQSPAERADVSARTLVVGIDHRFGWLGVNFEVERWGDPGALESADRLGALYVQGDRFRLAYERIERDIDIELSFTGPLGRTVRRTVGLDARGNGLRLSLELADRWRAYAGHVDYRYTRDLRVLPRIDALNLLSASALTLAHSFIEQESTFGVEWSSDGPVVNLSYTRDRSAVDGTALESLDGAVLLLVAPRIDLELNLGRSASSLAQDGWYGGVLVLIYGG